MRRKTDNERMRKIRFELNRWKRKLEGKGQKIAQKNNIINKRHEA